MNILGIETSCDETAAAVVQDGRRILSSVIASSVEEQALYGGIVPEIASRRHIEHISRVCRRALEKAALPLSEVDAVALTFAPGLIGALLVGLNFGKSLAFAASKPIVPVHHLRGHVASLYLTEETLTPPFLCLVASGGHCHLVQVADYTSFTVLGRTVDDAAGEAFDKVARTLGLGYPGGPAVANAAEKGDPAAFQLPDPHTQNPYDVSFSGLKTAVLNIVNKAKMKGETLDVPGLAASFQNRAVSILAGRLRLAGQATGATTLCLAGGVAANAALRTAAAAVAQDLGARLVVPPPSLCGDNAAMIASQGCYEYKAGHTAGLGLNGSATWPMEEAYSP